MNDQFVPSLTALDAVLEALELKRFRTPTATLIALFEGDVIVEFGVDADAVYVRGALDGLLPLERYPDTLFAIAGDRPCPVHVLAEVERAVNGQGVRVTGRAIVPLMEQSLPIDYVVAVVGVLTSGMIDALHRIREAATRPADGADDELLRAFLGS